MVRPTFRGGLYGPEIGSHTPIWLCRTYSQVSPDWICAVTSRFTKLFYCDGANIQSGVTLGGVFLHTYL